MFLLVFKYQLVVLPSSGDVETGAKTVLPGRRKDFDCGGHFQYVTDLCVSEDGKIMISVGNDHLVRLWDIRTGNKPIDALKGHMKPVTVSNNSGSILG